MRTVMRRDFGVGLWLVIWGWAAGCPDATAWGDARDGRLRVAPFVADITPAPPEPLVGGLARPVSTIEHPLLAKGIVLQDAGGTYVLCSLDLCLLSNRSHAHLRQRLAEAAGTAPLRVALHEVQQHTAPGIDLDVQRLLDAEKQAPAACTARYFDRLTENVAAAVRAAVKRLRVASHVGLGWAIVDRVASSRRIRMPDDSIVARMSSTRDPVLRELPEGRIDPKLRTVAFLDGDQPLAYLHFYAMHPQSFYGDGRVTYDVPGIARQRLEQELKVPQIYFPGCGGNITMGKYNDGSRGAREALSDRLYEAMARSVKSIRREPVAAIQWKAADVRLPLRSGKDFAEAGARRIIADTRTAAVSRIKAAMILAWTERVNAGRPVQIACLQMGSLRILSLPGDTFVEYQLWAQQICPDKFVAVAGFGDFGMCYLCTDQAYTDRGGYEQTFSFVDPCESLVKQAAAEVLGVSLAPAGTTPAADATVSSATSSPRNGSSQGDQSKSLPVTLIIDDAAPCINVYRWHAAERQKMDKPTLKSGEPVVRDVPVAFAAELAEVLRRRGIKGKFSVLPYPAGLGSIAQGLQGYSQADVDRWLAIVRREIAPRMDITPEILTHTKALDLATHTLLSENEREWSTHQTAETLTPYIAEALRILKAVDLPATGVTSPWDFGSKVEPEYRRAILNAQQQVNGRRRSWYFLYQSGELSLQSKVVHRDADGWLVSIVSQCPDVFWQTMETKETSDAYVRSIADQLLTEDGQRGRAAQLFRAGTPVVMLAHWQSLFSNGRKTGLRVLDEVGRRVQTAWGNRAHWVTCFELADQIAAGKKSISDEGRGAHRQ
ncbi:MAG: hypothetical protein ACLQNE_17725 [Thermoguttaceae bacterium]